MFSNSEVIEASRKFVCVRIESYESKENQEIVRSYLNGRFENTAFCVLAPDGKTRLSRSSRGPSQVFRDIDGLVSNLESIASEFKANGDVSKASVPDFNSFKLALNVASADQRVLVLITAPEDQLKTAEKRMRTLAWHPKVQGKFQFDLESDASWKEPLSQGADAKAGIYLIKPGTFGLEGTVLERLDLEAPSKAILEAMAKANTAYAKTTEKKVYSTHLQEGRSKSKRIEMAMPFGEDRDGDGEIDLRGGGRRL